MQKRDAISYRKLLPALSSIANKRFTDSVPTITSSEEGKSSKEQMNELMIEWYKKVIINEESKVTVLLGTHCVALFTGMYIHR